MKVPATNPLTRAAPASGEMMAAYLAAPGDAGTLQIGPLVRPVPQPGEVLVRVHATAITPSELQWFPTFHQRSGAPRPFPVVLSHEFSGVVAATGGNTGDFAIGEEVFGMNDWFVNGAQAEYCVAPARMLARKPRTLSHAEAATVPISALTAWQGLVVRSRLNHTQTVLIHGAAGSVGVFAVQIARECGARVIATASAAQHQFLRDLGADDVIDYRTTRFEDVVGPVDVVFDTQGGDTLRRSWSVLRPGGSLVTIAAQSERETDPRVKAAFLLVEADGTELAATARVIDAGRRSVFVAAEFPLERAREAYAQIGRVGRGKTVLQVAP